MRINMVGCWILWLVVHVALECHGSVGVDLVVLDLPWHDQFCCDSTSVHPSVKEEDDSAEMNGSGSKLSHRSHCSFGRSTSSNIDRNGGCVDVLCSVVDNWEYLNCDLEPHHLSSGNLSVGAIEVRLQWLVSSSNESKRSNDPVRCASVESFRCSLTSDKKAGVAMVTLGIFNKTTEPVLIKFPTPPVKPRTPTNLSHIQTVKPELILMWEVPNYHVIGPLVHQVRYTSNSKDPVWQVNSTHDEPRLVLDLKLKLKYTIQVRSSTLASPPLWSDWSDPHYIYLDTASYIPEKIVVRPGQNVSVYCVFNNHSVNANAAKWMLNFKQLLNHSHSVNERVSKVTLRPSETGMYDLLRCTPEWTIPYSQIYVQGAAIAIKCVTNGDIDAMDCSWTSSQMTTPNFKSRWADMMCDEMEEKEGAGEVVGGNGPGCPPDPNQHCTIRPVRMNCYKLWLEIESEFGPIRSKPVYLSPEDHIKANPPSHVKAISRRSGVLKVTWLRPTLPVNGLQCQLHLLIPSSVGAQPEWKVYDPSWDSWVEVAIPDMCWFYTVQVRCVHTLGSRYWGDWSELVHSTPENSRAPERGPDFWRILQEDPEKGRTNVTLLLKPLHAAERSYCVKGFIVQQQPAGGAVHSDSIEVVSSHNFVWNHDVRTVTVTVEAFNNLGSSEDNTQMTLERRHKRRCVRSFHVLVVNSTCVSLLWTLLDNSSVPLYMVVQWSRPQQQDHNKDQAEVMWARVPFADDSVYLKGDFYGSEEIRFQLFPIFADGEGEPVSVLASREDPAASMMLMIVSMLFIVLIVSLIFSQNKMKRFVWKEVPNPNNCSWARGLDFRKVDTFNHVFQPQEGLHAWPLLLPSENISQVVIVDKTDCAAFTPALALNHELATIVIVSPSTDSESLLDASVSDLKMDELNAPQETSGQSSVAYATVVMASQHQDKDGSGCSSSDEGNFSANNSDISGLWELDDPRRSCSLNSVDEFYEASEPENEGSDVQELNYLGLNYLEEEESEEEVTQVELLKNSSSGDGLKLYVPQFRTEH